MKTTNKASALDDHKMEYELTGSDPKKKKIPLKTVTASHDVHVEVKPKKVRRPSLIKTYFKCMLEVILA